MNPMVGLDSPKTMKLIGVIGNKSVVLVDSNTSHNFIDGKLVKECNLPLSTTSSYGIVLGTKKSVCDTGIFKGLVLFFTDVTIINDFLPFCL